MPKIGKKAKIAVTEYLVGTPVEEIADVLDVPLYRIHKWVGNKKFVEYVRKKRKLAQESVRETMFEQVKRQLPADKRRKLEILEAEILRRPTPRRKKKLRVRYDIDEDTYEVYS